MRLELDPQAFKGLALIDVLKAAGLDGAYAKTLLWQGSVWHDKKRIRHGDYVPYKANPRHLISVWKTQYPIFEYSLDESLVAYEDDELLIVYKPPGLNTSESVYSDIDCLTWGVQKYLNQRGHAGQINTIHRLDRDTQGLVLYAKSKDVEKYMYRLFMDRKISKRYLFAVDSPTKSLDRSLKIDDSFEYKGKTESALTHVIRLPRDQKGLSWFLALPQTGKTHQIRKHSLARLGPIVGDDVYGTKSDLELHLVCVGYRFVHPLTQKTFRISKLPQPEYFTPHFWHIH